MIIIIFGFGSIGRKHSEILLKNYRHDLYLFRSKKECVINELGIKELHSWNEVKAIHANVAFITNPTFLHIETALKCASLGMHLFIEKPLSDNLNGINALNSLCRKNKLTCYTAYCLRFHPVINKIRELLKNKRIYHAKITCSSDLCDWRKNKQFQKCYSRYKKMGGGVILDLSHELDYILYLFGNIKEINGVYHKASDVTVDSEDIADMILTMDKAFYINLHINFLSKLVKREIIIDFKGGYIYGDLINNSVQIAFKDIKNTFYFKLGKYRYLEKQTDYFLNNIGKNKIINNLSESKKLLGKILAFKNAR